MSSREGKGRIGCVYGDGWTKRKYLSLSQRRKGKKSNLLQGPKRGRAEVLRIIRFGGEGGSRSLHLVHRRGGRR